MKTTPSLATNQQPSHFLFSSADNRPLLQEVLPKLRPFQREALEFAVSGKRYDRQFTDGSTNTTLAVAGEHEQDGVASGAFTNKPTSTRMMTATPVSPNGRILLADEMG